MKIIILPLLVLLFFSNAALSQESEAQKLTQTSLALYRQGKLDEAISAAEQVVALESAAPNKNPKELVTAIFNLASLKRDHYWRLRKDVERSGITESEKAKNIDRRSFYNKTVPAEFRRVIEIYEKQLKYESAQLGEAKIELANYLFKFDPATGNQLDNFLYLNHNRSAKGEGTIAEIEALYLQGFELQKKYLGAESDAANSTLVMITNFFNKISDYDKSMTFYEEFIRNAERKYGAKSKVLVPALRSVARVLSSTEREAEAAEYVKRIEAITAEKEPLASFSLDLTLRSKTDELEKMMTSTTTITSYLKKQKWLLVNVWLDEKGNVLEAKAEDPREKDIFGKDAKETAEKKVRDWKFRPFVHQGAARKIRGTVWFPYFIKA